MRRLVLIVLWAAIGSSAVCAEEQNHCKQVGKMAHMLMDARQLGVPMSDMMDVASKSSSPEAANFMRQVIIAAYEQPRFGTDKMKQEAVVDFENDAYLKCVKES